MAWTKITHPSITWDGIYYSSEWFMTPWFKGPWFHKDEWNKITISTGEWTKIL